MTKGKYVLCGTLTYNRIELMSPIDIKILSSVRPICTKCLTRGAVSTADRILLTQEN